MAKRNRETPQKAEKIETNGKPERPENKRRQIRFHPDENALAEVRFPDLGAQKIGLLYEESAGGCSAVLIADKIYKVDLRVVVTPGRLSPMLAEIKWVREIHPGVVRVGFRYLE